MLNYFVECRFLYLTLRGRENYLTFEPEYNDIIKGRYCETTYKNVEGIAILKKLENFNSLNFPQGIQNEIFIYGSEGKKSFQRLGFML